MEIIVKDKVKMGRTRSQHEEQLRKEGVATMSDGALDRCKYLERQGEKHYGSKDNYLPVDIIDGAVPRRDEDR